MLSDQQRLLRDVFAKHRGEEIDTQGDSFFVAFRSASDAVEAAVAIQRTLADHAWPEGVDARVRIGIHSGEAAATDDRYVGFSVHRAARIGAAAHGGQVLLSASTRELVEDDLPEGVLLRDLGPHRLKDVDRPERISQIAAEGLRADFPQLRTGQRRRRIDRRLIPVVVVLLGGRAYRRPSANARTSGLGPGRGRGCSGLGRRLPEPQRQARGAEAGTGPGSVAAGDGAVWVANVDSKSVSRVDPTTNNVTQTVTVGSGPAGLAVGGGFVWLANSLDGTLSKIDPRSNGGTRVDVIPVGNQPAGVAYGLGSVWVANSSDRTVVRIDPRSDKPLGRAIQVDAGAEAIAVGDGAVWVTSGAGNSVARIDPRSRGVQAIAVGNGPAAIAVGSGAVWVANSFDGTVSRIDPATNDVKATIQVGEGPSGVAVSRDARTVWVSNELGGTLSRIDPARNSVVQTVETGNRPEGIAVTGDTMYVAVRTSGLAHRGGTLTIYDSPHPYAPTIDPAIAYATTSWQILVLTNDGLTGFSALRIAWGRGLSPTSRRRSPPRRTGAGRTRSSCDPASATRPAHPCGRPTSAVRSSARSRTRTGRVRASSAGSWVPAHA